VGLRTRFGDRPQGRDAGRTVAAEDIAGDVVVVDEVQRLSPVLGWRGTKGNSYP
jgi:hypothetical protein